MTKGINTEQAKALLADNKISIQRAECRRCPTGVVHLSSQQMKTHKHIQLFRCDKCQHQYELAEWIEDLTPILK